MNIFIAIAEPFSAFFVHSKQPQNKARIKTQRRGFQILNILLGVAMASSAFAVSDDYARERAQWQWLATWTAPPMAQPPATEVPKFVPKTFENQTIRQNLRISVGGNRVRVRISNVFGTQALRIGSAHVALHGDGAAIVSGTDHVLKFGGLPSIDIPAGAVGLSDPVDFAVPALADLAVSLYFPTNTGPATFFENVPQTAYISGPGDFTGAATISTVETIKSRFFLSVVEVSARKGTNTIVAIGDSVTKGATDTNWPGFLFARFNSQYGSPRFAVVNQGIGCGRTLRDFCGPSAASRFDRDVLTVTGATHVIVALGLVDIILPSAFGMPNETASASDIIVGLKQLIERAHAQDLTVIGATITPVGSSLFPNVYTPENEATRKAVNRWIRTSGAFDNVIDFDAVVRDPNDPKSYAAIYTVDGIHPNDAGNELMANAINLAFFE